MAEFKVTAKVVGRTITVTQRAISPELALKLGRERIKQTFPSARAFTVSYNVEGAQTQTAADFVDPNRSNTDED